MVRTRTKTSPNPDQTRKYKPKPGPKPNTNLKPKSYPKNPKVKLCLKNVSLVATLFWLCFCAPKTKKKTSHAQNKFKILSTLGPNRIRPEKPGPTYNSVSLYSLYYAEACNEFVGSVFASWHPGNTTLFKEILQRWRAVGDTVFDLTGPIFEPKTSRFKDVRVTARPTTRLLFLIKSGYNCRAISLSTED